MNSAFVLAQSFKLPVLSSARLTEGVEGADADEGIHFFGQGPDAQEEIGQGREGGAGAFGEDGVFGAIGKPF